MTRRMIAHIALAGLALSLVIVAAIWLVVLPAMLPAGQLPFDFYKGSMTFDQARDLMLALGERGRSLYRYVLIPLDMVLVVAYGAGIGCAIVWLRGIPDTWGQHPSPYEMRRRQPAGRRIRSAVGSVFLVAPFLAAAFDFWENILVFRMLGQGDGLSIRLLEELNRTSGYKWAFLALSVVALFFAMLGFAMRRKR
ncbi:hypothetical protein C8N35_103113 [Breoghania corrubedonensis]|uniref:Uncharacterized protein n=1 Tax=Breoghania corrubedonensis TaxID=665038 RepID=A0A2T5VB03_9HYPH|nr:hypothetical protein [Breoghania corrubedonensis]PTW60932.1 hypothetical protein C8N35_103113 [Breoghania corrubedonensis]